MKAIILTAGYGTRLYPYTKDTPKCFLTYKNKKIIDYILDDLEKIPLSEIIIVTNNKFFNQFDKYIKSTSRKVTLLNDGSHCNEDRLGAGDDIIYALTKEEIQEEVIVMGSDNYFEFSLLGFIEHYNKIGQSGLMYYTEYQKKRLRKTGIILLDDSKTKVLSFYEKPDKLISNYAVPPIYIFSNVIVSYLKDMISCNCDSPGLLLEQLVKKYDFYAYIMPGNRIDIESLFVK